MVKEKGLASFKSRDSHHITIEVLGEVERYEIVKFFDFTNDRKMMSIVVRQVLESGKGELVVYSKGADSAIKQRCPLDDLDFEQADRFASKGLRTLAFATR
jgi:magnesium-transporting ATPase (P-type)